MKSLRELYKIGRGPSSSHTIGPEMIARNALARFGQRRYRVELFGSLALTGKGHGTDRVLCEVLGADTDIVFNKTEKNIPHPNYMKIYSLTDGGEPENSIVAQISVVTLSGLEVDTTPDLSGMTYEEAKKALEDVGLYLNATGSGTSGTVFEQLVLPGTPVELGATVEVKFAENTEPDNGLSSANGDWAEDPEQKDQTQTQTGN